MGKVDVERSNEVTAKSFEIPRHFWTHPSDLTSSWMRMGLFCLGLILRSLRWRNAGPVSCLGAAQPSLTAQSLEYATTRLRQHSGIIGRGRECQCSTITVKLTTSMYFSSCSSLQHQTSQFAPAPVIAAVPSTERCLLTCMVGGDRTLDLFT